MVRHCQVQRDWFPFRRYCSARSEPWMTEVVYRSSHVERAVSGLPKFRFSWVKFVFHVQLTCTPDDSTDLSDVFVSSTWRQSAWSLSVCWTLFQHYRALQIYLPCSIYHILILLILQRPFRSRWKRCAFMNNFFFFLRLFV